jgi:predicted dehydrogenase
MKVAQIGIGYWGSKLTPYIEDYFEIVKIANSSTNLDVIWNNSEIEAVFIITPIETHYELVKKALESGKHAFVEKPLAETFAQAEELYRLAEEKNLKLFVDYTESYAPSRIKMKEILPRIGKMQHIEGSCKHLGRFFREHDVYKLLASHLLSMFFLMIDNDYKEVDYSIDNWLFNNKIVVTAGDITLWHNKLGLTAFFNVNIHYPGKEYKFTIYGEKGTIQWDVSKEKSLKLTFYDKKYKALPHEMITEEHFWEFDEKNNLKYSVEAFYEVLHGKRDSNAEIAAEITRIIESC